MRHTLTAVFDNRGEAQHLLTRLLAAGYSHADAALSIAVHAGHAAGKQLHACGTAAEKLFARLFKTLSVSRLVNNPSTSASALHVLAYTTACETEIKRDAKTERCLITVDDEEIHARRPPGLCGATHAACRPGTEPGALQNDAHANSHYFGTRDSDNTSPLGTTFKASSFSDTNWASIGVGAFRIDPSPAQDLEAQDGDDDREESSSVLVSMDDEASRGYQYRIRRWKAATAALKANWTLHHPGELPPWGKFKDAVLHGWGRINLGSGETEADRPPGPPRRS